MTSLKQKKLNIITTLVLFAALVFSISTYGWFATSDYLQTSKNGIDLIPGSVGANITAEAFHYNTNSPVLDSEIIGTKFKVSDVDNKINFNFYDYDGVFKNRNNYIPVVLRIGISGISPNGGVLSLRIGKEAEIEDEPDPENPFILPGEYLLNNLPSNISSIVSIKGILDASLYSDDDSEFFLNVIECAENYTESKEFTYNAGAHIDGFYDKLEQYNPNSTTRDEELVISYDDNGSLYFFVATNNGMNSTLIFDEATRFIVSDKGNNQLEIKYTSTDMSIRYFTYRFNRSTVTPITAEADANNQYFSYAELDGNYNLFGFWGGDTLSLATKRGWIYSRLGNLRTETYADYTNAPSVPAYQHFNFWHIVEDIERPIYGADYFLKNDVLEFQFEYTEDDFVGNMVYLYLVFDYDPTLISNLRDIQGFNSNSVISILNDISFIEVTQESSNEEE